MSEGFSGQTVVVTGAAGGIGRALCALLVAEGSDVVALDRDEEGLARLGPSVRAHRVELGNPAEVASVFEATGAIDVLINNAGTTALGTFDETPKDSFDQVVSVNLLATANVTRAALEGLKERRGRIAVLSSVAGFAPLLHRTAIRPPNTRFTVCSKACVWNWPIRGYR